MKGESKCIKKLKQRLEEKGKTVTNCFKSPMGKKYNRMSVHSVNIDYVNNVKNKTTGPKWSHLR